MLKVPQQVLYLADHLRTSRLLDTWVTPRLAGHPQASHLLDTWGSLHLACLHALPETPTVEYVGCSVYPRLGRAGKPPAAAWVSGELVIQASTEAADDPQAKGKPDSEGDA